MDDQSHVRTRADREKQFLPMVRAMHETALDHIKLSIVRRELPAQTITQPVGGKRDPKAAEFL